MPTWRRSNISDATHGAVVNGYVDDGKNTIVATARDEATTMSAASTVKIRSKKQQLKTTVSNRTNQDSGIVETNVPEKEAKNSHSITANDKQTRVPWSGVAARIRGKSQEDDRRQEWKDTKKRWNSNIPFFYDDTIPFGDDAVRQEATSNDHQRQVIYQFFDANPRDVMKISCDSFVPVLGNDDHVLIRVKVSH
jgi:hypothetical protein